MEGDQDSNVEKSGDVPEDSIVDGGNNMGKDDIMVHCDHWDDRDNAADRDYGEDGNGDSESDIHNGDDVQYDDGNTKVAVYLGEDNMANYESMGRVSHGIITKIDGLRFSVIYKRHRIAVVSYQFTFF